jgi:3-isopropylmalate dehydrogenase
VVVGVLPGEGIGPEVVEAAILVLTEIAALRGHQIDIRVGGQVGNPAVKASGQAFPDDVQKFCSGVFADGGALFCGAAGARFVYLLREYFDLYCKFVPIRPTRELESAGPLNAEAVAGADIVIVRENTGGLYFGEGSTHVDQTGELHAYHRFSYSQSQVDRIVDTAARLACLRNCRLAVVQKAEGIPVISELWLNSIGRLRDDTNLTLDVIDIDNAVYQLIADARRFDVIVTPNMFGDVLADCGSLLLGSRGLSYSANFGEDALAVYQTAHGAAYDIAGKEVANPMGQLYALAMLLQHSFGWVDEAQLLRDSMATTISQGHRTADVALDGAAHVGTKDFTQRILHNLHQLAQ